MNIKTGDIQQRALGLTDPRPSADGKKTLFTASTAAIDRAGDVIRQDGWEVGNYLKNPVFLWAHKYDHPAIGKATSVGVVNGELEIEIEWAPTAFAQDIKALYDGKFMRAVSVGFRVLDWTYSEERDGFDFLRQELTELSAVPIGCNQEALAKAASAGLAVDKVKAWAQELLKSEQPTLEQDLIDIERRAHAVLNRIEHLKSLHKQAEPPAQPAEDPQPEQGPRPVIRITTSPAQGADKGV